jgi:hypothetical protein
VAGEFVALLVRVRLPLLAVPVLGAKETLKVVVVPAARVYGSAGPVTLNPAPVVVAAEMLTLPVPVLVTVSDWVLVDPSFTLPKARRLELVLRR